MSEQPLPLEQLRGLLEKLREAQARTDERAKATHERFNVFTTLLEPNDEVRLHSRFLHCLLNPQGRHDCGVLFLKLFFETLKKCPVLNHEGKEVPIDFPDPDESWKSEIEFNVPDVGRIDILLKHQKFGIAIENKPNPDQHTDQLQRYADWLQGQFGESWCLFYLTHFGNESRTHHGRRYYRISYERHILAWLEKCLEKTYHIVPVNQVLLQYRKLVRDLTGKTIESEYMKHITDFIKQNPDLVRCRREINDGIDAACSAILDKLAEQLIEGIKRGMGDDFQVSRHGGCLAKADGALIVSPPQTSILGANRFEIWITKLSNKRGLIVGIVSKQNSPEIEHLLKSVKDRLFNLDGNYSMGDENELGCYWPAGWHVFLPGIDSDETLASLHDTETLAKKTIEACGKIKEHIKLLEQFYSEAYQATKIQS